MIDLVWDKGYEEISFEDFKVESEGEVMRI